MGKSSPRTNNSTRTKGLSDDNNTTYEILGMGMELYT